ncbi:MAG: thioesterase [Gammaproteobacteria bacterium]|nr:thioesterase [Gammaproteobacteria bacterium]
MMSHSPIDHPLARSLSDRNWLIWFNRESELRLRLFCFPYAGGDANIFRAWANAMPTGVEVIGVQYPGRGANDAVPPIDRCDEMVARLHMVMSPWLQGDFAFFGHSNGALISFELARRLVPDESRHQRHHFFSGRIPPHLSTGLKKISSLADEEFLRELRNIGGTPLELLGDRELMNLIVDRLRADFALGENYVFQPGRPLACDISTLHGDNDDLVDGDLVKRWSELTKGCAHHYVLSGNHFFLNSRRAEVLMILRLKLQQIVFQ